MILEPHREGLSVSAIDRQLEVDRKTVRKYIERGLRAPCYGPRQPRPTVVAAFEAYLRERIAAVPELTGSRLLREIRELGYAGGYTAVKDFLRTVRPAALQVFERRFETPPGRQAQVDFAYFRTCFTDDPMPSTVDQVRRHLVGLKMPRALEVLDHVMRQLERGEIGALEAIDALLGEELTLREGRRIKAALRMGRLASLKTLAGFDFSFQPSLDRNRILALAQLEFVDRREVVHFLGQPGCGKTHLAIALGVEAVKAGRSVYFCTLAELIASLAKAEREGNLRERLRFLCRPQLLIVDEIGYLPVVHDGGNLFFQLVNARYERGAMILTSNRGFAEWGDVFGHPVVATALLDRLLHHAVVIQIEGASYRLRQHADLITENRRTTTLPGISPIPRRRGRPPKQQTAAA